MASVDAKRRRYSLLASSERLLEVAPILICYDGTLTATVEQNI